MLYNALGVSIRKRIFIGLTFSILLGCTFLYKCGLHCVTSNIALKQSRATNSRKIPSYSNEQVTAILKKLVQPKHEATESIKSKKIKLKLKKVRKKSSTTTSPRTTLKPKVPIEDKWSDKWPRVNINNCSHLEYMNRGINSPTRMKTFPYPRTGIVSFPGSGNTWTRYLIQQATGLWTGSVYTDRSLFKGGFKAELDDCDDNSTVGIKAHYPRLDTQLYCRFDRAVLVIRDPFRAVLAEFNWRSTSQHTGVADPRLFKTKLWKDHVSLRSQKWLTSTEGWITRFSKLKIPMKENENPFTAPPDISKRLLFVSYERMKENAVLEMERVVKFLGLPVFRKHCVEDDVDGNFFRKSKSSESIKCLFEKFNSEREVDKRIEDLQKTVRELGLGDITSEFEGLSGDLETDKCKYL